MSRVGRDVVCRVTSGLYNPYNSTHAAAGTFVTVHPGDPVFGPLIGTYLIPVDRKGNDLPVERWPGYVKDELEEADAVPPSVEEPPEQPQEPVSGAGAGEEAQTTIQAG